MSEPSDDSEVEQEEDGELGEERVIADAPGPSGNVVAYNSRITITGGTWIYAGGRFGEVPVPPRVAEIGAQEDVQVIRGAEAEDFVNDNASGPKSPPTAESASKVEDVDIDRIKLSDNIWMYVDKKLSSHHTAMVYEGIQLSQVYGSRAVAVKLVSHSEENKREAQMLAKIANHANVVGIIHADVYTQGLIKYIYIVMEKCHPQNLYEYIRENKENNIPFNPEVARKFSVQLLEGLHHIHKHGVLHRDLKPQNILFSLDKKSVKIVDFGLSKELPEDHSQALLTRDIGSDGYRAPETFKRTNEVQKIGKKSDTFSLGCVTYHIWSDGLHPFGEDVHSRNHNIINNIGLNLDHIFIRYPDMARQVLRLMLSCDPKQRPTTEQLLQHPCFRFSNDRALEEEKRRRCEKCISEVLELRDIFEQEAETDAGIYFDETDKDTRELPLLIDVSESKVLLQIWRVEAENCARTYKRKLDQTSSWPSETSDKKEFFKKIWEQVKHELCNFVEAIFQESVPVDHLREIFVFAREEKMVIQLELKNLFCFVERIHDNFPEEKQYAQSQMISEILANNEGLVLAHDCLRILRLKGDFRLLKAALGIEGSGATLGDMRDASLTKFRALTESQLEILRKFLVENDLISWVLRTSHGDFNNLMAMFEPSSVENHVEIDRRECLLSAVLSFGPLLFDIDVVNNLDKLYERFEMIVKGDNTEQSDRDDALLLRWRECARVLQWYIDKEKQFHSFLIPAVILARRINAQGLYTVESQTNGRPTIENCISLKLQAGPEEIGENFGIRELEELKSKLTVTGVDYEKDQQEITQFIEIFNSVKSLAESFRDLVEAGCWLFKEWKATISLTSNRIVDGQNDLNLAVRFTRSSKPLVEIVNPSSMQTLTLTLKHALQNWTEYISNQRMQHYYLNDYSIRQIAYLSNQLASVKSMLLLPDQVYAMLYKHLPANCLTPALLQQALNQATRIEPTEGMESDDENGLPELSKKVKAIRTLVNEKGLTENEAKAAVYAVGYMDLEDCVNWALLHQYNDEIIRQNSIEFQKQVEFENRRNEGQLASLFYLRSVHTLVEMIDQTVQERLTVDLADSTRLVEAVGAIWRRILELFSVLTMRDNLSVNHLGKFLATLHVRTEINPAVHRTISGALQSGKPNLIVCSDGDTIPVLLSLYMDDSEQPLPSTFEVMLCTAETTVDDVERFLTRAMTECSHKGKPLFCMGYVENLSVQVSTKLEKIFERLSQQCKSIYQLAIILEDQNHHLYHYFERYVVKEWEKRSDEEITSYLKQRLISDVSPTGSMAQVITSRRSGAGKSLHIKSLSKGTWLDDQWHKTTIRLSEKRVDISHVIQYLNRREVPEDDRQFIHIDLTPAVEMDIEKFMFSLLILGTIEDESGNVWNRHHLHFYAIEVTEGQQVNCR